MPGVADLSLEANIGKPQIRISVNRDEMARHGMNAEDVLTIVRNGLGGEPVSVLLDGVRRFDIAVRLDDRAHQCRVAATHPAQDRDWCGRAAVGGRHHRSGISPKATHSSGREQLQRYAVIQMDVRGRDIDGFVRDANAAIAQKVKLPPATGSNGAARSRTSSARSPSSR